MFNVFATQDARCRVARADKWLIDSYPLSDAFWAKISGNQGPLLGWVFPLGSVAPGDRHS